MNEALSLIELNSRIKDALNGAFTSSIWVVAEISEMNRNRTGHCYLELVQKDENAENLVAKARATIWSYTFRMMKPYFETTTGHEFTRGIKILVKASVEFHELYGLSLNITDIDPSYTMGDIERQKKETIARLEAEGVIQMNKDLVMPMVPLGIAVISSETAAGYGDFMEQLLGNPYQYKFSVETFPAMMQGEKAPGSIVQALEEVFDRENQFDLVVIIRGGGSKTDLSCFDDYWLCYNIAQFPLPVLTGIGHERDESIADLVAHTRLKTPTAVAEYLVETIANFEARLDEARSSTALMCRELIYQDNTRLKQLAYDLQAISKALVADKKSILAERAFDFKLLTSKNLHQKDLVLDSRRNKLANVQEQMISRQRQRIETRLSALGNLADKYMVGKMHQLELLENTVTYSDPFEILRKGYSITLVNNKKARSLADVGENDQLSTIIHDGLIKSKVNSVEKKNIFKRFTPKNK